MNNAVKFFGLVLLLFSNLLQWQDNNVELKNKNDFELGLIAKIGYGRYFQSDRVDINGTVNEADIFLNYSINKNYKIGTGIGVMSFGANGTHQGSEYYLDQVYIRIPVTFTYSTSVFQNHFDDRIRGYTGFGFYTSGLIQSKETRLTGIVESENLVWNLGIALYLGVKFDISKNLFLGIGYEIQNDLSKSEKEHIKRKISVSTINFTLGVKF